ncbi:MAG: radical SAM protein [Desulfoarculaceae bacterium]|nr:radical SAM protein [Desulfoarculaceae bacterium]
MADDRHYKFSEILADPVIHSQWEKVRKYFFLRESTYDMTNRCNIRCEGCYYFTGEKQFAAENLNVADWQQLMETEKERGITFVVLAGAEPSLVPQLCQTCFDTIPLGCIASNGLKVLPREIDYRVHISVWGNDQTSLEIRKAKDMLARQMANYRNDPRAVWVYTFTPVNIDEAREVTELLADNGHQITFNMFSSPVGYQGHLRHTPETLARTRAVMSELLAEFPRTVLFSPYNSVAHTHERGLHELFSCSYPRMNPSTAIGLGRSFRQYRTDLQWDRDAACCVPDTDCADCRHYAAGSAVVTARMYRHATNPTTFAAWLDYVDTYLAVWVRGYEKSATLCQEMIEPPAL